MIIWQGLGFLALLIPIARYAGTVKLLQLTLGMPYTANHSWPGALGTLLGAALVYLLALRLEAPGRTLLDPRTGQGVTLKRRHTLFWMAMRIAALAIVAISAGMLILEGASPL